MKERFIFSSTIIFAILLAMLLLGVHGGVFILALIAYFMQFELYVLFEKIGLNPMKQFGLICGAILIFGSFYLGSVDAGQDIFLISFLLLVLMIARIDIKEGRMNSLMPTLFGFIYIPYLLHFFIQTYHLNTAYGNDSNSGLFMSFWVVLIALSTDIGGYLFGKTLGKTKFSIISPNKTNEGVIGGVLLAPIVGVLLVILFAGIKPDQFHWWQAFFIAIPLALSSIASDLLESAFKRQAGEKDSSNLIPGIGGVFDMCDSLILTAPLAYLLLKYFVY
jgi:phosphatidate cytidylyltransferase